MTESSSEPRIAGWMFRDAVITTTVVLALWGSQLWHQAAGSLVSAIPGSVVGFVGAYVLCYIYHEWGHLIGARAAGARMPLLPYRNILIGSFDPRSQSRAQFLALSWGGVIGYSLIAVTTLFVYFQGNLGPAGAGFAVGGLAFLVQSLSVDLPQIFKVMAGADPTKTNAAGAHPKVILRRTWQSWSVLTLVLIGWNLTG